MTLSRELKQSVIQQVEQGKQYRDISKGMNISIGSIANIVLRNKYEQEHVQPSQSVNTQLQTSTGNSTTFTPVYPSLSNYSSISV
jgi:hypothetical protein